MEPERKFIQLLVQEQALSLLKVISQKLPLQQICNPVSLWQKLIYAHRLTHGESSCQMVCGLGQAAAFQIGGFTNADAVGVLFTMITVSHNCGALNCRHHCPLTRNINVCVCGCSTCALHKDGHGCCTYFGVWVRGCFHPNLLHF